LILDFGLADWPFRWFWVSSIENREFKIQNPMSLTPEQKAAVSAWIASGDNLSAVQKKLTEQFKISMTYMDVRFLVDDLGLELKNAAPKADASDVTKATTAPVGSPAMAGPPRAANDAMADTDDLPPDDLPDSQAGADGLPATGASTLTLEIDRIMRPGAMVSGTVTFSDGVSGKWALDQQGRLMLDTPQKGYKPSPVDVQAFQLELQTQLQRQGF
jgi:hypothetical protein